MSTDRRDRQHNSEPRSKAPLIAFLILFALVAGAFGAKFSYHWLKARRAEQFAAEGEAFVSDSKWSEAAEKYRAALQLDPLGYRGLRDAAQLATRLNRPEAGDLWQEVMKTSRVTAQDRQDYAELLIKQDRLKPAEEILEQLLKASDSPEPRTLAIAAQYSQKMGNTPKAVEFMQAAINRAPNDDQLRFQLANLLAGSPDARQHADARKVLWDIAGKDGPSRQAAIEALGGAPDLPADERNRVLQSLDSLKSPTIRDSLMAADLRLQISPEQAAQIYDQTIARWNSSATTELIELARWLNLHLQPERVLSLYSVDTAFDNDQLLLSRLDALATLQRWNDVDSLLTHPNINLDPSVVESFRARTAMERNSTLDAEMHWNHAISFAGSDPLKLRFVANFAEQSNATGVALRAYDELAKFPEYLELAYRGTQRLSVRVGDLSIQRSAAAKIAAHAPDDPNASAQIAYLNLLTGTDIDANTEKAKALVEKYPQRLSFRVAAALGFLRKNDPGLAMTQFKPPAGAPPIEWEKAPPAWRAVYAAALRESGQEDAARQLIATIPMDKLNAEERVLIQPK